MALRKSYVPQKLNEKEKVIQRALGTLEKVRCEHCGKEIIEEDAVEIKWDYNVAYEISSNKPPILTKTYVHYKCKACQIKEDTENEMV